MKKIKFLTVQRKRPWGEDTLVERDGWLINDFLKEYGVWVTAHEYKGSYLGNRWRLSEYETGLALHEGKPGQGRKGAVKGALLALQARGITREAFVEKKQGKPIINTIPESWDRPRGKDAAEE